MWNGFAIWHLSLIRVWRGFRNYYGKRDRANQKAQINSLEYRNYAAQRPDGRPPESQLHPSIKEVAQQKKSIIHRFGCLAFLAQPPRQAEHTHVDPGYHPIVTAIIGRKYFVENWSHNPRWGAQPRTTQFPQLTLSILTIYRTAATQLLKWNPWCCLADPGWRN